MKALICYCFVVLIGMTGMGIVLFWTMMGEYHPLLGILSMIVALIGCAMLREERGK